MTDTAKKKREMPSSLTILLLLLVLVALIALVTSALVPKEVTAPALSDLLMAPVRGFADALPVCLFVLILGGYLSVIAKTGALDTGIAALVNKFHGNELMIIPVVMVVLSLGGTTYGMCEETVPFYTLLAATMMAAGFDPLVGAATVLLGAGAGCLGPTVNPFSVGAALDTLRSSGIKCDQSIIIGLGALLWAVTTGICIFFVMSYAKKVKARKDATVLSSQELASAEEVFGSASEAASNDVELTGRQKAVLGVFAFTFVVMIAGFVPWEDFGITFWTGWSAFITGMPIGQWYFDEASTWFVVMALVIGVVGGLSEEEIVGAFVSGVAEMVGVVLGIALARGVSLVMASTEFDQFVLKHAADALSGVSGVVFTPMSYLVYLVLSFLIPSTSGMASVSMPIMGPLAQGLGFRPEVMVQVMAAANGLVNFFTPTSGVIVGGLALARVELATWLKFAFKVVIAVGIASVAILTLAMLVL